MAKELYAQAQLDDTFFGQLPAHVDLPDAPFTLAGYRRAGDT